jgi:hypothetical protein
MFKQVLLSTILVFIISGCHAGIFSRVTNGFASVSAESRKESAEENIAKSKREIKVLEDRRRQKLKLLVKYIKSSNEYNEQKDVQNFISDYIKSKGLRKLQDGDRRKALLSYRLMQNKLISNSLEFQKFMNGENIEITVVHGFQKERNFRKLSSAVNGELIKFMNLSKFIREEGELSRIPEPPKYEVDFTEEEKAKYRQESAEHNNKVYKHNLKVATFNWTRDKDEKFYKENFNITEEKISTFVVKSLPKTLGNLSLHFDRLDNKGNLKVDLFSTNTKFSHRFNIEVNNLSEAKNIRDSFNAGENNDVRVEFFYKNGYLNYSFTSFVIGGKNYLGSIAKNKFVTKLTFDIPRLREYNIAKLKPKTFQSIADASFENDLREELEQKERVAPDSKKWLLVIGVENYDEVDEVPYSVRSSKLMIDTFQKLLGVPRHQTYKVIGDNATENAVLDLFKKVKSKMQKGDTLYFYYTGHGLPSQTGASIMARDSKAVSIVKGDSKSAENLKLKNIYHKLQKTRANKVVAIVDSCFSGSIENSSGKKKGVLDGRGLASSFVFRKESAEDYKKVRILTAGGENDFSNSYDRKGHRLFTYSFLKQIIVNGEKDLDTIFEKTKEEVFSISRKKGRGYDQTPTAENLQSGDEL